MKYNNHDMVKQYEEIMSETKIKDVIDNNIEKFIGVERQENTAMGLSKMIHKSLASVLIRNTLSDIFQAVQEKKVLKIL